MKRGDIMQGRQTTIPISMGARDWLRTIKNDNESYEGIMILLKSKEKKVKEILEEARKERSW